MSSIYNRTETIALHPGKCNQDVVFHMTQEKKNKTKLFKRLQNVRYLYMMLWLMLASQAHWEKKLVRLKDFIVFFLLTSFPIETVSCFFLASIKSVRSYINPEVHQILISLFVTNWSGSVYTVICNRCFKVDNHCRPLIVTLTIKCLKNQHSCILFIFWSWQGCVEVKKWHFFSVTWQWRADWYKTVLKFFYPL